MSASHEDHEITKPLIEQVRDDLIAKRRIHVPLPGGGTLRIDRLQPFLCVYRQDPERRDPGTARLVMSEASYLLAPGTVIERKGLKRLVRQIAATTSKILGSFLVLEIWSGNDSSFPQELDDATQEMLLPRPSFRITAPNEDHSDSTVDTLKFSLQRIRINRRQTEVVVDLAAKDYPSGLKPLLSEKEQSEIKCRILGLEVRPIFREPQSLEVYESVLRSLCRQLSTAIKKACFNFALNHTSVRPEHYFSLGSSKLPKQIQVVDRQLAEISGQFKFLLLITPINAQRSWQEFSKGHFRTTPEFHYRPLSTDPLLLKRRLLKVGTERVNDPTLENVFRDVQVELDRQISMLADIGTPNFLPGSLQVFGRVDPSLLQLAKNILSRLPPHDDENISTKLNAAQFAKLAKKEIQHYAKQSPLFLAQAMIRDDMFSGLLATGGNLLVGRETQISAARANALLQHEVGTHLVTHYNGALQPLRLLQVGLAGYEGLQEGFAVLSEYLVGGLSGERLRTLAARVIACEQLVRETPFADVFQMLVDEYGFEQRNAYTIAVRVYRGGGLTKDALYLKGLVEILRFLGKQGDLELLLVGKIAANQIPVIRELMLRGVLRAPMWRPRYLDLNTTRERLEKINKATTVLDLIHDTCPELAAISDGTIR